MPTSATAVLKLPAGIYLCTVLVDHGGRWLFSTAVNRLRGDPDDPPWCWAGRSSSSTSSPAKSRPPPTRTGSRADCSKSRCCCGHAGFRGSVVAGRCPHRNPRLPGPAAPPVTLRLHRLEDRFDLMVKSLWAATGLLVASGTYLLLNQTAYETPFSAARIEAAFRLPYTEAVLPDPGDEAGHLRRDGGSQRRPPRRNPRRLHAHVLVVPAALDARPPGTPPGPPGRERGRTAVAELPPIVETSAAVEPERTAPGVARAGALVLVAGTARAAADDHAPQVLPRTDRGRPGDACDADRKRYHRPMEFITARDPGAGGGVAWWLVVL